MLRLQVEKESRSVLFDDNDDEVARAKKQKCLGAEEGNGTEDSCCAAGTEHFAPLASPSEVVEIDVKKEWMPVIVHMSGNAPEVIDLTNVNMKSVTGDEKQCEVIDLTKPKEDAENENAEAASASAGKALPSGPSQPENCKVIDLTSEDAKCTANGDEAGNGKGCDLVDVTAANGQGSGGECEEVKRSILYSPSSPANSDEFLPDIPDKDEQNQLMNKECADAYNRLWLGELCQ